MGRVSRAIYVPGMEKWVSLYAYLQAIRKAKANLDMEFKHTLCSWSPGTGKDVMREFRAGMHKRISEGISYSQRGFPAI